jgi:geranylgeranyl diphosphate synthase, type I
MATVEAPVRTADEILAWSRTVVDPVLREAVASLPASMRRIAEYHFGWRDEDGREAAGGSGKAIRPALTLLSAEAVGAPPGAAVNAAVAVELVHNFSLLHDDVMDGDLTRRHRATAWAVFGASPAILAGDALLTLALDVVKGETGNAVERLLVDAVQQLLEGQAADLEFEERERVTVADCIRMSALKTGALLGCACGMGAACGPRVERVPPLREFGELLGLAFQFVDDLLGIWGDPTRTGKPVFSDLTNHKKSLPVVWAMASHTPAGEQLRQLYGRPELSTVEVQHCAGLIETAGARDWAREQADDLLARALSRLPVAGLDRHGTSEMIALAERMIRRDR